MSSPPSIPVLPRHIDPRKFAQQRINIEGQMDLAELTRLLPLLADDQGHIQAQVQFGIDEQGLRRLTGDIDATLSMVCQRCLDAAEQTVNATLNLAMVWSDDDANRLPKSIDPWVVGEGQIDLYQVIEDELILSLPIVAYHHHSCVSDESYSSGELDDDTSSTAQQNPFQVLATLKQSDSHDADK